MEFVRAGFCDHADDRSGEAAKLRIEAIGQQAEFPNGIEHRYDAGAVGSGVFYRGAVHQKAIGILALAIDRKFPRPVA